VQPNNQVGRFLQETLALLPTNSISFDQMFTNGVQDVLMVIYLANLTRSHLLLAEKLKDQTPAQPAIAAQ
jgi:translation initiation factor 3 subunit F